MCGIVGAIGTQACSPLLLDALKRLEYRGYDSSGIVALDGSRFDLRRAVGKLVNLDAALTQSPLAGTVGIGHTRWATHGGVSEMNAHPHVASDRVAIVHNGIIENYRPIRARLIEKGHKFSSDTDSEVLAHLFVEAFDAGLNPGQAMQKVLAEIDGAYAFAAIVEDFPDVIMVARNASPLAIGLGEDGSYIGSDATALAHLTRKVIYLKDHDYALVRANGVDIFLGDGTPANRETVIVAASPGIIDKGGYRHFMEKEIHEQPDAILNSLAGMTGEDGRISANMSCEALQAIDGIVMLAAGTSHYASQVARYWIEGLAKTPVACEIASEYHYRNPVTKGFTTAIAISQSGESLDTLKAMRHAATCGLSTIGLVNVDGSTIAREADAVLPTHAGPEIGVASTKAFTAQLTVLISFAVALAEAKGHIDAARANAIHDQLQTLPGLVGKTLKLFDDIRPIAHQLKNARSTIYLGRGHLFPIAMEGALKLKELSYIHAEGFASGEMKHGPIALIEDDLPVVALLAADELMEKAASNLKEASARGGRIILIADERAVNDIDFEADIITVPAVDPLLAPIILTIPVQILAYLTALDKGTDVDQPRNLAKSVTVE
ncbi:glutamine--fructose-6-phosphate transaminase (isomerizing) [Candidatus Puniceispirillum sp.]|uniref:glutamine--fructose-6-phosphate transaminase (isomerizing) n=1 Tax=Candidatus Puniceispirillum sp. TaxID=2026719 RepID=UPI003F6A00B0